jgi:uncharacterized protein YbgA (DUF1722 family)/uncharacterized protein YbbK (DUF523 family)
MADAPTNGDAGERPHVGISACLLGAPVRYDGGHKQDHFLTDTLGRFVQWVPVCPEVECGLLTPREPMHLEGDPGAPRLVTTRTHVDHTDRMLKWAARRLREVEREDLWGFVFKANSPSCGIARVRVYGEAEAPRKAAAGIFARALMERLPLLPVEDEGRLCDFAIRDSFIERLFALRRYRELLRSDASAGGLVAFHAAHKMQLMAHGQRHLSEMGRLVAGAGRSSSRDLLERYGRLFADALSAKATVAKSCNVLLHVLGFFKKRLAPEERQELLAAIERYRQGHVPLLVPIVLVQHCARKCGEPYLQGQTYLNPSPVELMLRNHA